MRDVMVVVGIIPPITTILPTFLFSHGVKLRTYEHRSWLYTDSDY